MDFPHEKQSYIPKRALQNHHYISLSIILNLIHELLMLLQWSFNLHLVSQICKAYTAGLPYSRFSTHGLNQVQSKKQILLCTHYAAQLIKRNFQPVPCFHQLVLNSMLPKHSWFFLNGSLLGTIYLWISTVYCIYH
jgi:hypothetical protein